MKETFVLMLLPEAPAVLVRKASTNGDGRDCLTDAYVRDGLVVVRHHLSNNGRSSITVTKSFSVPHLRKCWAVGHGIPPDFAETFGLPTVQKDYLTGQGGR